jgi:hypothetical protein
MIERKAKNHLQFRFARRPRNGWKRKRRAKFAPVLYIGLLIAILRVP